MKLITLFLLSVCLHLSAKTSGQQVTINADKASLEKVLRSITKQTGYDFWFDSHLLARANKVKINVREMPVEKVLALCFIDQPFDYRIVDKTILIREKPIPALVPGALADLVIRGHITDEKGGALPGATVALKDSKLGTAADAAGNFTLKIPDKGGILVVTFIGYETLELPVSQAGTIDIVLKPADKKIDEIVVVGFGTQKKTNLTSSVNVVKMDELLGNRPVSTTGTLLQGVVPGLQVTTGTGEPGGGFTFNIRGTTSINGGGPLILVDNVPFSGALNLINPNDIESVTVLKDAGSAAIYGASAAFGVVLITTKKGTKNSKIRLDYSNNFTFSKPSSIPKAASPMATVQAYKDMGYGAYWTGQNVDKWLAFLQDYQANPGKYPQGYTTDAGVRYQLAQSDVIGQLFDNAGVQQMHDFAISGGTEKTVYRVSLGTVKEDGIMITNTDSYKRYNLKSYISTDVTNWLTTQLDVSYYNSIKTDPNSSWLWNIASNSPSYVPTADTMTVNGVLYPAGTPKNLLLNTYPNKDRLDNIRMMGKVVAKPMKGLTLQGEYLYENIREIYTSFNKPFDYADISEFVVKTTVPAANAGFYKYHRTDDRRTLNLYGTYARSLGKHNLSLMAGYNQDEFRREALSATKTQMISTDLPSIATAVGTLTGTDGYTEWSVQGFFGRFNYDYKGKYLLEVNGRTDGSSKFPANHRWGFFPSASAGWRISEEHFMQRFKPVLSDLKVRASFGEVGNQDILPYRFLDAMNPTLTNWLVSGSKPTSLTTPGLVSPNFTWETVRTLNFGLNVGFMDNRLNLTADWYRRQTLNMLTSAIQLPAVMGTGAPLQNAANLQSQGYELMLEWRDKVGDFSYYVSANLYDFKSKITKFDNNKAGSLNTYYVGKDMNEIWGYTTDRLYQESDFSNGVIKDGLPKQIRNGSNMVTPNPGDVMYKDVDGNGIITNGQNTLADHGDLSIIGNNRLSLQYGVNGGLGYKNWSFSFVIAGVGKRDLWISNNLTFPYNYEFGTIYQNELDYWTPTNTKAHFARIYAKAAGNSAVNKLVQSRYLSNAAYLRIKNLSLAYALPNDLLKRIHLSRLQVFFSGENLFTFTKFPTGLDPTSTEDKGYGINYPIMRMFSFGINASL
ncbi:TonB-linked SusC/RagA family outer membrane protein [Chitinophaga dinghuensis]|uniref:TonB-linked SusC/RagA family outer membrane protein n=1 Tax=Chitinophaga dinghuensis TaxID=1539050 RepID=A0A327VTD1_9BACT|nr:TonB-dependent receptor [Chitinophaga dinghuensis]RAJ79169.1 TonB-linked SusC/RagA family outer membrane protein [Chitinophaga dinghuensis]